MAELGTVVALIKSMSGADPAVIEEAVQDWLDDHPEATTTVQDGSITEAKLAQDVLADLAEIPELKEAIVPLQGGIVSPEQFGAVGDGETDDSQAVQDACDAGYAVYFASNKTYYLASTVTINHDCHLFGGENTVIKTKTPSGGTVNDAFRAEGTLKKETTLTTDYSKESNATDNSVNRFTLADMENIEVGDIMVVKATDQYFSYARQYYYLGATLLVTDVYNDHIYANMGMEYDIENTANVSVEVYDAPTVIIEGLKFVSDLDSFGSYRRCLDLIHTKNSVVKNCEFSHMETGLYIKECVNTLVENVLLSKSKYDNSMSGDGYGVNIESCTQTVVRRVNSLAAQGCICLGGTIPVIDTFVYDSHLNSECRAVGFDMHENAINTVLEDCTLGGAALCGTVTVNRCRIFKNMRPGTDVNLKLVGSHDPSRAIFKIKDCIFDDPTGLIIDRSGVQSPIQSFENVIGLVQIEGCEGGFIVYDPTTSADVTSNTIEELLINRWKDCKYIYHNGTNAIEYLEILDSNFIRRDFLTDYNESHGVVTTGIKRIEVKNSKDRKHQMFIDKDTNSESIVLSKGTKINVSSNNNSALFVVCGNEFASDDPADYFVGSITGTQGNNPSRSKATGANIPSISSDGDGGIVWDQGSNTSKYSFYPFGFAYVKENSTVRMSAKIYNTGNTTGEEFSAYILVINGATGKVRDRSNGSYVVATADGKDISYSHTANAGDLVVCYYYCSEPVNGGQTTFKDMHATIEASFAPTPPADGYEANRRTGDGTILAIAGENNIMCSEMNFHVNVQSELMYNTSGW